MRIAGFTYEAENLCVGCTEELAERIVYENAYDDPPGSAHENTLTMNLMLWAQHNNIDIHDESSYDSGEFPKPIDSLSVEDNETCSHCGEELV